MLSAPKEIQDQVVLALVFGRTTARDPIFFDKHLRPSEYGRRFKSPLSRQPRHGAPQFVTKTTNFPRGPFANLRILQRREKSGIRAFEWDRPPLS
jgi:hypothetical protein